MRRRRRRRPQMAMSLHRRSPLLRPEQALRHHNRRRRRTPPDRQQAPPGAMQLPESRRQSPKTKARPKVNPMVRASRHLLPGTRRVQREGTGIKWKGDRRSLLRRRRIKGKPVKDSRDQLAAGNLAIRGASRQDRVQLPARRRRVPKTSLEPRRHHLRIPPRLNPRIRVRGQSRRRTRLLVRVLRRTLRVCRHGLDWPEVGMNRASPDRGPHCQAARFGFNEDCKIQ